MGSLAGVVQPASSAYTVQDCKMSTHPERNRQPPEETSDESWTVARQVIQVGRPPTTRTLLGLLEAMTRGGRMFLLFSIFALWLVFFVLLNEGRTCGSPMTTSTRRRNNSNKLGAQKNSFKRKFYTLQTQHCISFLWGFPSYTPPKNSEASVPQAGTYSSPLAASELPNTTTGGDALLCTSRRYGEYVEGRVHCHVCGDNNE